MCGILYSLRLISSLYLKHSVLWIRLFNVMGQGVAVDLESPLKHTHDTFLVCDVIGVVISLAPVEVKRVQKVIEPREVGSVFKLVVVDLLHKTLFSDCFRDGKAMNNKQKILKNKTIKK